MTELRQLTEEDRPGHARLMAEAFESGARPASNGESGQSAHSDQQQADPSIGWGVFEGARLIAAAAAHPLHVTWGDHDAPLGGIAGVACTVAERGRGHVDRLLKRMLIQMRESGQYLSGLYPFSFAFYRRYGWEWVGERRKYDIPTRQIPSFTEGRQIRTFDGPDALETIKPVYAAFARRYRSVTTREDAVPNWWQQTLEHRDNRTTYVHVHYDAATAKPDGYLTFRFGDDSPATVGDLVANTPAAYRGLLSVLHYYGTQIAKIEWGAPVDDLLPLYVMHWDLKTRIEPLFMGRVVDLKAAFESLHSPAELSGEVILRIDDPHCDWNSGVWAITAEGRRISATRSDRAPGIVADIQALSQAYWGQPALTLLRAGGRVDAQDQSQYALLAAILPPMTCYLQDRF